MERAEPWEGEPPGEPWLGRSLVLPIQRMTMTKDEIFKKVQAVLVDALGVDEDEVTPTASLSGDLGAESIDFLDISFRLEKAFTTDPAKPFKIPRGELFPENLDPSFVQDNKLTDAG